MVQGDVAGVAPLPVDDARVEGCLGRLFIGRRSPRAIPEPARRNLLTAAENRSRVLLSGDTDGAVCLGVTV